MKKSIYFLAIAALALAGAVEASTLAGSLNQAVKSNVEVAAPKVEVGGDVDVVADTTIKPEENADTSVDTEVDVKTEEGGKTETETADSDADKKEDREVSAEAESSITVRASEVRGWNPEKKAEVLGATLTHSEVRSEEDLSNFAASVVMNDENIDSIEVEGDEIDVVYAFPAKFLGFIKTTIHAHVTVAAKAGSEERVKVKFPWLAFLYKVDDNVKSLALTEAIDVQLQNQVQAETATDASVRADVLDVVSAALRVKHDVLVNASTVGTVETQ